MKTILLLLVLTCSAIAETPDERLRRMRDDAERQQRIMERMQEEARQRAEAQRREQERYFEQLRRNNR